MNHCSESLPALSPCGPATGSIPDPVVPPPGRRRKSVTELLADWRRGESEAVNALMPIVYQSLWRMAAKHMRGERHNHTLQSTALVHEAFERVLGVDGDWQSRKHFFAVVGRMMRRVLIDHARSRSRERRHGNACHVSLDECPDLAVENDERLLELDEQLTELAHAHPRKAQVLELHFFSGMTYDEIAGELELSPATVHRELRFARAWLCRELDGVRDATSPRPSLQVGSEGVGG